MNQRSALLLGATGLVGGFCLQRLLEDDVYERVVLLGRKPLDFKHPKLSAHVVDFERSETFEPFTQADDVFCCIGTTRAQVASERDYRKIDFDIPVHVAESALRRGASQLLIVSSVGAEPRSKVFYTRLKGEIEQALSSMPFKSVHIFRPSVLLGNRGQSRGATEAIVVEAVPLFSWALVGPFRKYKPVHAAAVANAMVHAAEANLSGTQIYEFDRIVSLAG